MDAIPRGELDDGFVLVPLIQGVLDIQVTTHKVVHESRRDFVGRNNVLVHESLLVELDELRETDVSHGEDLGGWASTE